MKVVGLITEYNPFHNGHKYHIEEAKRITGADYAIAVMSGNFVQRGTPAVMDKYSRAEMALHNGVDLVLELPVCYATGSAEFFAHGAVSLLEQLGIVDYLCFGSECGNIDLIKDAAKLLLEAPDSFEDELLSLLKEGLTYPAARLKALEHYLSSSSVNKESSSLSKILMEPNNILGIEYMKAIYRLSSSLIPVTIKRQSAHYHDLNLTGQNTSATAELSFTCDSSVPVIPVISSATAIRNALQDADGISGLPITENSVPADVYDYLSMNYLKTFPITIEDFSEIIKYKLMSEDALSLARYVDITSDLADRMKHISNYEISITELSKNLKTKNLTLTRINRALIHMLLNITADTFEEYNRHGYASYARVLGIKETSSHLLRKASKIGRIPIITKVSSAEKQLDSLGMQMFSEDLLATHLYNQAIYEKFKTSLPNEYKHGICII